MKLLKILLLLLSAISLGAMEKNTENMIPLEPLFADCQTLMNFEEMDLLINSEELPKEKNLLTSTSENNFVLSDNNVKQKSKKIKKNKSFSHSFVCDIGDCERSFKTKVALSIHKIKTHIQDNGDNKESGSYACTYQDCSQKFKNLFRLNMHKAQSHPEIFIFTCNQRGCNKKFETIQGLIIHQKNKNHTKNNLQEQKEQLPFQCDTCSYKLATKAELANHIMNHHYTFKCDINNCLQSFQNKKNLKIHQAKEHQLQNLNELSCPYCATLLTFENGRQLIKHKKEVHSEIYKYICDKEDCNGKFETESGLKKHITQIHNSALILRDNSLAKKQKTI